MGLPQGCHDEGSGRCQQSAAEQGRQRPSEFEPPGRLGLPGTVLQPVLPEDEKNQGRKRKDRRSLNDEDCAGHAGEQAEEAEAGCQPRAQDRAGRNPEQDPRRPPFRGRDQGEGQKCPDGGGNGEGQQDRDRHGFRSFR